MILGDLLSELRNNILNDRSAQISGASDYLWSDATLVRYIDEAQRRMARGALLIRDGTTPSVTQVPTFATVKDYQLDSSVLAVLSVRCAANAAVGLVDDIADLARAGHASLSTYRMPDTYFFDPSSLSALPPGKIVAFETDEQLRETDTGTIEAMNLRVYPAPDAAHVQPLRLRVIRLPINRLSTTNLNAVPEIPEIHHLDMLDWAAYLALRIVDVDAGMPDRAAEFKASFEVHMREARDIMMRKLFAPSQFGFGRNGWSWETN